MKGKASMQQFAAYFSKNLKDGKLVNPDIINIRKREDMAQYIDAICKETVTMIPDHMTYLGYKEDDRIGSLREIDKAKIKKSKTKKQNMNKTYVNIEKTYARSYVFRFTLKLDGQIKHDQLRINIPLICEDGVNYIIKGNKYSAPLQIVDAMTSTHKDKKGRDAVDLKPVIRTIQMARQEMYIVDTEGREHFAYGYMITLNSKVKEVPFVLFYLAKFNFWRTMDYFGFTEDRTYMGFNLYETLPPPDPSLFYFKYGTMYISVSRAVFLTDIRTRDFIATLLMTKKRSITPQNITRIEYWETTIGAYISKAKATQSGKSLVKTFEDTADKATIANLNRNVHTENLKTIYSICRWMFATFSINVSKDSSMCNKKIRYAAYLVEPIKNELIARTYRFIRAKGRMRDMKRLEDILKVSPSILIDSINGKSGKLNIPRYDDGVNDFQLFNSITKTTKGGPGTPITPGKPFAPMEFRRIDPSMAGRLDLVVTSKGDPGISGNLVPNCKIDPETLMFIEDD